MSFISGITEQSFIKAYTNHLGVPIVISGFLIAFSKICSLHRREISSLHVLSLHSPHECFRAKSPSFLESLNHSLVTDERKKWTIITAYTNHLGVPIVISGLLIAFSKIQFAQDTLRCWVIKNILVLYYSFYSISGLQEFQDFEVLWGLRGMPWLPKWP